MDVIATGKRDDQTAPPAVRTSPGRSERLVNTDFLIPTTADQDLAQPSRETRDQQTKPTQPAMPIAAGKTAPAHQTPTLQKQQPPRQVVASRIPPKPLPPPGPSLWNDHIQPFFAEHWYIVAGVVMMIAGSSLLAYYTWDKHWAVRYTIMPALLGCCTAGLAWMGSWTERRDEHFKGTAAILRGAAIGLLPINFMAVALLSRDMAVANRALFVPMMGAIYLGLFGVGLKNWCAALHVPLGWLLGGTLLLLNSLVMIGPLAETVGSVEGSGLLLTIGAGFHLGFLVLAAAVVRFTSVVLTKELAEQKRVPWFFGATLAITFLQVFAWVHGYLEHLPRVYTYAPMLIMAGGLVLLVERRALALRDQVAKHGEESFVGFALIALGVLMGTADPYVRILSFVLAGAIWLTQTMSRREPLHHWIGLTLVMLGGASVGMLPVFPLEFLPVLGIGISVLMGAGSRIAEHSEHDELRRSANGMQVAVLFLSTIVTVLIQWHLNSQPIHTGGYLLLLTGLFGLRAYQDNELRWLHTAMGVLAVSLMYLGCVDMSARTLEGNTMVFGLSVISILWLALNWMTSAMLIRDARSTVLWVYGALAVAGMVLRVFAERALPPASDLAMWMDYSGPLMMSGVLVFATWYSRSLIPAVMAAIIVIILFPELKAQFQQSFETLGWGSGLGSALSALVLTIVCFPLQKASFLKNLEDGDRFLGKTLFPARRYDHSLFTWPLLASVLFLTFKTDTWTLIDNLLKSGALNMKTAIAVLVTSVTWTTLAVYARRHLIAPVGTYLGALTLLVGLTACLGSSPLVFHWPWPILITGAILHVAYAAYLNWAENNEWVSRVLARPTSRILRGSSLLLAVVCILILWQGFEFQPSFGLLIGLVSAQLIWQALSAGRVRFLAGGLMFVLHWLTLVVSQRTGSGDFLHRLFAEDGFMATMEMVVGFQILLFVIEFLPDTHTRLSGITIPYLAGTSLISVGLSLWLMLGAFDNSGLPWLHFVMLFAATMLTARAHGSGAVGLLSVLMLYVQVMLTQFGAHVAAINLLTQPLPLAAFGLILAALARVGEAAHREQPLLVAGQFGLKLGKSSQVGFFLVPAAMCAVFATARHTIVPGLRADQLQLWAPYLSAVTMLIVGRSMFTQPCRLVGLGMLTLGNIHFLRVFFGETLLTNGVSQLQIVCLGVALTLLQGTLLKFAAKRDSITHAVNQGSLIFAGLILGLIAANYIVHPNLAKIEPLRFVISGAMAYLAGLYFRRAARHPDVGEEPHTKLCEGLYHVGVTVAIWCLVLLVPSFRHPAGALCSLGFPLVYFYVRAELLFGAAARAGSSEDHSSGASGDTFERYRNSASVLSFAILTCYVFRTVFQMIWFPDEPRFQTIYYHYNAPFIVALSFVLLRLHGLGGTSWLAFYGGLTLMTGTYFSVTWLDGLSPFTHAMPAAWAALGLSHFWTLVSNQRSPLRTAIQRLAAIDGQHWYALRRSWGVCLLIVTQIALAWGLTDWKLYPLLVAPLLVGAASILIHQGAIRRSPLYFGLAGMLIVTALHADFFVDSYLAKEHVVWALLGIWAAVLVIQQQLAARIDSKGMGIVSAVFAAFTMAHVFWHHPCSTTGLVAVALLGLLAALTPRPTRFAQTAEQFGSATILLVIPTWLAFFSQATLIEDGLRGAFHSWTLLFTTSVLFLTGIFARVFQTRLHHAYDELDRSSPRLFDHTLSLLGTHGININTATLWSSFGLTVLAQITHYAKPLEHHEIGLILALYAGLTLSWFFEGRLRRSMPPYFALQLSVLGFFAVIRRQLMLTTEFWSPEYDVWASLVVSLVLTGAKQIFDTKPQEVRIPLMGTLLALPAIALVWSQYNGMGSNVAMLIVGLHSLMFTYMGKDDRESPYNVVAIGGFVTFVMILFWNKLELRVLHAYTIPVGVAILVLLQIFRHRVDHDTRNRVRLVTLVTMIASAGYYALVDDNYPIAYNLTMIVACIATMLMGSLLRIRLYLVIGFAGLMLDVLSLVFKLLRDMERGSRMTVIGSLVLIVGLGLVFGAIYFKTHRDRINERMKFLRSKVGDWE